ncbi:MAG: hypothetical protein U1E14_14355 [Geminicoccaceae bacterium]
MPSPSQRPIQPVDRRSEPLKAEAIARDRQFEGALTGDDGAADHPPLKEPYGHTGLGRGDPALAEPAEIVSADHAHIRGWAERLGGRPALVSRVDDSTDALLRIVFPGSTGPGERVEAVDWPIFFEWFEDAGMALRHQDGSRQHRLVRRTPQALRRAAATTDG